MTMDKLPPSPQLQKFLDKQPSAQALASPQVASKLQQRRDKAAANASQPKRERRFKAEPEDVQRKERPLTLVYFADIALKPLVYSSTGFSPAQANTVYQGRIDISTLHKGDLLFDDAQQIWEVMDRVHHLSTNPRQPSKLYLIVAPQKV